MARYRPAHGRSGFGRFTPPGRIRPAHAAPPVPNHLARRAGVLLGTGVLASASYGGTATADVSGDTTGYAVANSAGTVTTDTETDTSSVLSSTSPDAGGMGFAYDADGNWVASLNFNGTDKVFSNVGNG